MSDDDRGLSHHPSPQRSRTGAWETAFSLLGGPAAWFVQHNLDYALLATPCYPGPARNVDLPAHAAWTWPAALVVYAICLIVALASGYVALRLLRRTRDEAASSDASMEEAGTGRTRFLAYWGLLLGFGFAAVIFVDAVALIGVPPCAL